MVLASLALCWGCAAFEAIAPPGQPGLPPPAPQVREPAPPIAAAPPIIQDVSGDGAAEAEEDEPRAPLKEGLLAALRASAAAEQESHHVVKRGETLGKISTRYGVTLPMLKGANRLKTDHIQVGQRLIIPKAALRIQIDKSENQLRLFHESELVRTYPVATGDQGVTPIGAYTIANRLIRPTWYWQGYAVPPDDPEYPLGSRWLGLSRRGYGIHGTNEPELIGQQVSHGCIRMLNADVEELFDVVAIGTPVTIVE